jgi:hypothetical protein
MIKIYKDFFDSDCLEYIGKQIERSQHTSNFRSSYPTINWGERIVQESAPVMIYDMVDPDILQKRLKEVYPTEKDMHFMIYYWPVGSYVAWHPDNHVEMTASVYMNKYWNRDWGGLFLYEEGDKILAEIPEWNKLVLQSPPVPHASTPVTKSYFGSPDVDGGWAYHEGVPIIRTTIQIFEATEEYKHNHRMTFKEQPAGAGWVKGESFAST